MWKHQLYAIAMLCASILPAMFTKIRIANSQFNNKTCA
jgi:hypothetical protein